MNLMPATGQQLEKGICFVLGLCFSKGAPTHGNNGIRRKKKSTGMSRHYGASFFKCQAFCDVTGELICFGGLVYVCGVHLIGCKADLLHKGQAPRRGRRQDQSRGTN